MYSLPIGTNDSSFCILQGLLVSLYLGELHHPDPGPDAWWLDDGRPRLQVNRPPRRCLQRSRSGYSWNICALNLDLCVQTRIQGGINPTCGSVMGFALNITGCDVFENILWRHIS